MRLIAVNAHPTDKAPLARLLTTDPQTNTSSLGMPDAFQPFAKPGWLPALKCAA